MPTSAPKPPLSEATGEFGNRVRERRHHLGLSQEALAEGTALHWSYIGQVERGQTNLTLHNILKIAVVLGVDPGELVTGLKYP
ncbi:helix-turn-helix transcriptional regulator [Aeromicrobium sp.]|uniref:helix-turn-helix domain-containing protein n=1 Tax=Aeromicrobium sp. TaxID=1871063 RepID=UPI0030BA8DDC